MDTAHILLPERNDGLIYRIPYHVGDEAKGQFNWTCNVVQALHQVNPVGLPLPYVGHHHQQPQTNVVRQCPVDHKPRFGKISISKSAITLTGVYQTYQELCETLHHVSHYPLPGQVGLLKGSQHHPLLLDYMHQFDLESREINHIQRRSVDGEPELNTQYKCTTGVSKAPGYHPPALMPHHILDHLIVLQGKGDQVHEFTREVQQAHQQSECYCPRSADVMMMYRAPLVARMSNMSQTDRSRAHGRNLKHSTCQLVITHHYGAIRPRHGRDVSGDGHSDSPPI